VTFALLVICLGVVAHATAVTLLSAAVSSVYTGTPAYPANLAIDGDVTTFAAADAQSEAYLDVTFASDFIFQVVVTNRQDSCGTLCMARIDPFYIFLKNGAFTGTTWEELTIESGVWSAGKNGTQATYTFAVPRVSATNLRILQKTPGYLNIAEVQVYKYSEISASSASVSSEYTGPDGPYPGNNAIDGNIATIAVSDFQVNPYLEVVYQYSNVAGHVTVVNRQDCCQERISPFYLFLKNSAFVATSTASLLSEAGVTSIYVSGIQLTYEIPIPLLPPTTRLRIVQQNTAGDFLNIADVHLYSPNTPSTSSSGASSNSGSGSSNSGSNTGSNTGVAVEY